MVMIETMVLIMEIYPQNGEVSPNPKWFYRKNWAFFEYFCKEVGGWGLEDLVDLFDCHYDDAGGSFADGGDGNDGNDEDHRY